MKTGTEQFYTFEITGVKRLQVFHPFCDFMGHNLNGSPTLDWIHDKERSGFAFEGMCWEKSKIPLDIWRAGDANSNLIESVHADVNCEGILCTLVGGVTKGQFFDTLKMKTLRVSKSTP